ncbi:ABC transporter substrate-binding protein [Bdellovibrionota bacterium]
MKNSIFRFATLFLVFVIFFGCAKSSKTPDDTLVVAIESMPSTLDPRFATDAHSQWITSLIFNALVRVNRQLEPEPEAAARIEMPDPQTYVFHLREDLKFHNGQPVTAEDVAWSIRNIVDPEVKSPFAAAFKKIKFINTLDKNTIKLVLDQPFAPFLLDMTLLKILPKEAGSPADLGFAKKPIGSGPFRLTALKNDRIDLKRDPLIEGKIPKVRFLLVQDMNTRFLKLKQGEVDFAQNALDRQLLPEIHKIKHLQLVSEPGIIYQYLVFNLRDPILGNKAVRQAIAFAIDREKIIEHLLAGFATPATSLLAPSNSFFVGNLPDYKFDTEKAKQLLDRAGYTDPDGDGPKPRFTIEYKTSNAQEATDIAQIIRDQLKTVGIEVKVRSNEWGTFYSDLKSGNFQIASSRLVGITDPDIYYDLFHSSRLAPAGRNRGFYINNNLDELVEKGRVTTDPSKRKEVYAEVQKIISNDLPYMSLWYNQNSAVFRKEVKGFEMYPNASFLFLTEIRKSP